jgi:acetyl-CoA carboxylase alpha subunit/acetyl-CoA carboxylase beta subunit
VTPPSRLGARELLDLVLDDGSFASWDVEPIPVAPSRDSEGYRNERRAARHASGTDESIVTGRGRVKGRDVAVVAGEFRFLAGSIGVAAAERLVAAVERATAERLPLLAAPSSGGTRMQEGAMAFVQMIKITQAVVAHKRAGLPYLVYLRDPTTGGVFASWGSLGQVTAAEPGARVGFLGPRVYRALYGQEFPAHVQTAENLVDKGLIDAVLPPQHLADLADRVLALIQEAPGVDDPSPGAAPQDVAVDLSAVRSDVDAWASVQRTRSDARPHVRDLLRVAAHDVLPLNGTGAGESHPGLLLAFAGFGGASCVLLGQDRGGQESDRPLGPDALRQARRGMRLADELGLPLVTVIDTPGAALTVEAEEGGLAGEIARSLADLVAVSAPTVALLLGQGSGGGALALAAADRVLAAEHAWLSPLSPEGASSIVHRDTEHAAEMARQQGIGAVELAEQGIVDLVVAERPDAAEERDAFCRRVGRALEWELRSLARLDPAERLAQRHARYRTLGATPPP